MTRDGREREIGSFLFMQQNLLHISWKAKRYLMGDGGGSGHVLQGWVGGGRMVETAGWLAHRRSVTA